MANKINPKIDTSIGSMAAVLTKNQTDQTVVRLSKATKAVVRLVTKGLDAQIEPSEKRLSEQEVLEFLIAQGLEAQVSKLNLEKQTQASLLTSEWQQTIKSRLWK